MSAARALLHAMSMRWREGAASQRRVLIVGYGDLGRELHRRAHALASDDYHVVATCDPDGAAPLDARIDVLGNLDDICDAVEHHRVQEIWIALPLAASDQLPAIRQRLDHALVDIRWMPDAAALQMLRPRATELLGLPAIELNRPAAAGMAGLGKAVFDRIFAAVALLALSPLLIAIALAIKCTSAGPVLFSQPRLGLNGQAFRVLKFRSMQVHQEPDGQVTQASRSDPRVTRIGQFLRRTSLDELPQFFNVLAGQMSVVGPRPHALPHNDLYKNKLALYMQRHRVKPGITGWAQINGCRGETDSIDKMARRIALDLDYIQRWSFWLDLKIILWTALRGWTSDNAY